jgi:hypothetical protein
MNEVNNMEENNKKKQNGRDPEFADCAHEAVQLIVGQQGANSLISKGGDMAALKREIETKADPGFVASGSGLPFTQQWKYHRQAVVAAYEARIGIFRSNVESARRLNETLNASAVAQHLESARVFLTGLRLDSEVWSYRLQEQAAARLLGELERTMHRLEAMRESSPVPASIIQAMVSRAMNHFAQRVAALGGLEVRFDYSNLLAFDFLGAKA